MRYIMGEKVVQYTRKIYSDNVKWLDLIDLNHFFVLVGTRHRQRRLKQFDEVICRTYVRLTVAERAPKLEAMVGGEPFTEWVKNHRGPQNQFGAAEPTAARNRNLIVALHVLYQLLVFVPTLWFVATTATTYFYNVVRAYSSR